MATRRKKAGFLFDAAHAAFFSVSEGIILLSLSSAESGPSYDETGMQTTPGNDDTPAPERANLLLVDDQPANLLALRAVLEDMGHHLVDAHSGEEAVRLLGQDDFAVILLDVLMPGLDGFETAKRIRAQKRSRHTPIIFLTAYETDRRQLEQAYALGAVDYLVKPFIPAILRAKVAVFVELFQKTEQVRG
jgi:CheY-like chemotaxis protein